MKTRPKKNLLVLLLAAGLLMPLSGLTVKMASPFPEGSAWDSSLKRMAAQWAEISGGEVRMRIYPGGVAGDEADMIRKMRFGQLDAGVLTSFGLKSIVPDTFVISLPGMLRSEEELNFAIEEFIPRFDEDFIRQGFRVLAWSKSGWANFYAKRPIRSPDQLRHEVLSVSNTDIEVATNFKALKFNVVPNHYNELMVALQSGMVSAFYAPPMASAVYQWFALAPHMTDFPLAPVLGGFVITERTWQRIPGRYHEQFQAVVAAVARDFYAESERLNREALRVMLNNGLKVERLTETETRLWYDTMTGGHPLVVGEGKWVDQDLYSEFVSILENMR